MDATMNSVEAKEESRQREDSMVVLVGAWRKCRQKREEACLCVVLECLSKEVQDDAIRAPDEQTAVEFFSMMRVGACTFLYTWKCARFAVSA